MRTLERPEYDEIWDAFYARFQFRPGTRGPFPAILEPAGSVTFDLAREHDDSDIDAFGAAITRALKACAAPEEEIYYLDWQHECFAFRPHEDEQRGFNGYPDGDYAIFLSKDLAYGSFGHPWECTICCFGDEFVRQVRAEKPRLLAAERRRR